MRAGVYLRISSDKTGEELGVTRQREDCLELAARRGWEVVAEYPENDTSGSGKVKRPKFEAMLKAVEDGDIDVVVAWNLDRLTRNRPDTVRLIELGQEKRLIIALARGSDLDMSTPMGRMMADQLAGWARYEIEQKSDRQKRANQQKAEKGLPHGARRCYGYEQDGITIDQKEAAVLQDVAAKFLNGWSYKELAYWLNEQGIATVQGCKFYAITVRNMLQRKKYAGIREYEGVEYQGIWEPIFDPETWAQIQYTIKVRHEKAGYLGSSGRYLLTGVLFCGGCGKSLTGTTKRDHPGRPLRRIYNCKPQGDATRQDGCGGVVRGAVPLEDFIKQCIVYRLDSPALAELLDASDESTGLRDLLAEQAALKSRLDSLLDDYTDGTLTKPEFIRARGRAQTALQHVEAQIVDVQRSSHVGGLLSAGTKVAEEWERQSEGWRRKLIDLLIERVDVQPGISKPFYYVDGKRFRFDPTLIHITFKV